MVAYANSLDPDETPTKLFVTQTTFSPTLKDIEILGKVKQNRNIADDNLFGGLRIGHA